MQGVLWEFRLTVGEVSKFRYDWQRIARRTIPVAACAAAGLGALCVRKRTDPPDTELLSRRAHFDCRPASMVLAAAAAVERSLKATGADVEALRRAARRMRGPLESDLLAVEGVLVEEGLRGEAAAPRRLELYRELVEKWRTSGYDREPVEFRRPRDPLNGFDYVTQVDESYGRDVGCEVPLCLLRQPEGGSAPSKMSTLSVEGCAAAADALREHGVVKLGDLLSCSEVEELREQLHVQVSALDRARSNSTAPVREYDVAPLQEQDPELVPVTSTPGRRHFYLRGRALEHVVSKAQAGAMPLVWEHLVRIREAAGLPVKARPYISEMQLLVTDPCAVDQLWHVDNTAPGLTLVVPLTQVPEDLGATLFLPGTHHLVGKEPSSGVLSRLRGFASSFLSSDGVVVCAMGAGDAVLYDSRLIHRGAVNRKYDRTCVALVFRYDFERPPGTGATGTQMISWTGNSLAALQRIYAALPGGGGGGRGEVAVKAK